MFRFTWNHHQALSKNIYPLHIAIKTRYGIPNVHNHRMFTIHMFFLCVLDHASSWYLNKGRPTWWHLLYYVNLLLNMFRVLIHPSSGVCDYLVRYCVGCNVLTWGLLVLCSGIVILVSFRKCNGHTDNTVDQCHNSIRLPEKKKKTYEFI